MSESWNIGSVYVKRGIHSLGLTGFDPRFNACAHLLLAPAGVLIALSAANIADDREVDL